jgi:hypothetical protein
MMDARKIYQHVRRILFLISGIFCTCNLWGHFEPTGYKSVDASSCYVNSSSTIFYNCTPPSITILSSPIVCHGTYTFQLIYTKTENPTEYRIDYDNGAESAGFTDISTWTNLPEENISLNIPENVSTGSYTANIFVRSDVDCESAAIPFNITINAPSVGGTVSSDQTICSGNSPADISLSGFTGNIQWQSSTDGTTWNDINRCNRLNSDLGTNGCDHSNYPLPGFGNQRGLFPGGFQYWLP